MPHPSMLTLRRRPQFWVAAWLIFQGSALYALVPRDCCAAHRHGGDHQSAAHHATPAAVPAEATPAAATSSDDHAHHGHQMAAQPEAAPADATPARGCVMRGTCDGPMAAVLAVLSTQGVPPSNIFSLVPYVSSALVTGSAPEHLLSRLASPEPPPPRA